MPDVMERLEKLNDSARTVEFWSALVVGVLATLVVGGVLTEDEAKRAEGVVVALLGVILQRVAKKQAAGGKPFMPSQPKG